MMKNNRTAAIAALIGKPYRRGADGPDAFDCYGLAAYVQREFYSVSMAGARPAELDDASTVGAMINHPERARWHPVPWPQDGDLVVMGNVTEQDHHLGTYIVTDGIGGILHTVKSVAFEDRNSLLMRGFNDMKFYRRRPEHPAPTSMAVQNLSGAKVECKTVSGPSGPVTIVTIEK